MFYLCLDNAGHNMTSLFETLVALSFIEFTLLNTGQVGLVVGSWPSNQTRQDRLPSELDYTS